MAELIEVRAPEDSQEGTFSILKAWLKKPGDRVAKDEPLAELETDKVAVEIAAPAAGVVAELIAALDAEIAPGALIARLSLDGAAVASISRADAAPVPASPERDPRPQAGAGETRLSPVVRRLVDEYGLDASAILGTGKDGRLTHADVLNAIEAGATASSGAPGALAALTAGLPSGGMLTGAIAGRLVPHTPMRRQIAAHMSRSMATAPHVTSVFEADFSAVIADRAQRKADFEAKGVALTFTAYIVRGLIAGCRAAPQVNARWREDAIELYDDVNVGVGVALGEAGLVVPVIKRAQALDLFGLAQALHEATERARSGTLAQADVRDGTITISNHGVSGSLLAAPIIINQPQAAILGVGKLEKRVVVRESEGQDAIVIRPMAYVTLTIDHRVVDAHQTNAFLSAFVDDLERSRG